MAIPAIEPYEIPESTVSARVPWMLDPRRCVVLVHDMQEYFVRAYQLDRSPMSEVLEAISTVCDVARRAGIPVVYSAQPGDQHPLRRGLLADLWGTGMKTGADTAIVDQLQPQEGDIEITKWRYSAFQRTDLREVMAQAGRDQLVVTGVYAHMGCQVTAVDAFMNDVQPFLVSDAVADFSQEEHVQALDYVAKRCGRVVRTQELISCILSSETRAT